MATYMLFSTLQVAAQNYPQCVYHYFKNKKVSTSQCFDKENRWGKATAYNKLGKIIYESELRHVGGSSSVAFSYYPDGAVEKARWHSAPDAGIQWYNTTTTFSPDGSVIKTEENNYDMSTRVQLMKEPVEYKPQTQKPETASCAAIYSTEYYYINKCKFPVLVQALRIGNPNDAKTVVVTVGDTVKGGSFIMAEQFVELADYYSFSAIPTKNLKRRSYNVSLYRLPAYKQANKETRAYFYVVTNK